VVDLLKRFFIEALRSQEVGKGEDRQDVSIKFCYHRCDYNNHVEETGNRVGDQGVMPLEDIASVGRHAHQD
jgi:hypothetical protein